MSCTYSPAVQRLVDPRRRNHTNHCRLAASREFHPSQDLCEPPPLLESIRIYFWTSTFLYLRSVFKSKTDRNGGDRQQGRTPVCKQKKVKFALIFEGEFDRAFGGGSLSLFSWDVPPRRVCLERQRLGECKFFLVASVYRR